MLHFLVLLAAAALLVIVTLHDYQEESLGSTASILRQFGIVVFGVFLYVLVGSFGIVQAGNVGIVTRFGGVEQGRILHEGLYMVIPGIESVHQVDTKPHLVSLDNDDAVTLDRQAVKTTVKLLVQVDPSVADQTYRLYRDTIVDQVVTPKFQEAVKTVTARYDAKTQVQNRGLVQSDMLAYVQHELQGKGVIIPAGALSITNFAYDPDYQKAIEDTQVAQQNLLKAQNDLKVQQIEAEQKVATARGEAESQALLAKTITNASLKYEFFKHWDGKLPVVIGSGANMLDVSSLIGKQ